MIRHEGARLRKVICNKLQFQKRRISRSKKGLLFFYSEYGKGCQNLGDTGRRQIYRSSMFSRAGIFRGCGQMPGNPYLHTAHKIKSYVPFLRVFCLRGKEYRRMAKELSEGLLCARFLAEGEPWIREENCIRKEKRITHYGIYLKQSIVSIQVSIWYPS